MKKLCSILFSLISVNTFGMFPQGLGYRFYEEARHDVAVYSQVNSVVCRHSLRCALYAESALYHYFSNPVIVLMGGVSSGKSTLINGVLHELGANQRFVREIPNGLAMADFIDFSIQQSESFVSTFPEDMRDFFQCLDSKDFSTRTLKKLATKFPVEIAETFLSRYKNEDFYYEKLVDFMLSKKLKEVIVTTHAHSYDSFLRLKRAVSKRLIRMPVYAFYYFVPLEELMKRTKLRNDKVMKKLSPFYDIRFSWDVFYDFFRNLSVVDAFNRGNVITNVSRLDTLTLLDNVDKQYLPDLFNQIFKVYGVQHSENFKKKRDVLRSYVSDFFMNKDRVDLFFRGDDSVTVGTYDFVKSSIKFILEHFVKKLH